MSVICKAQPRPTGGSVKPSDIPPSARGNANISLLSCPHCPDDTPVHWLKLMSSYSWCISISCSVCSDSWFCCTLCDYSRLSRFPDVNRRTRHHSTYHCGRKKVKTSILREDYLEYNDDACHFDSDLTEFRLPPQFSELLSKVGVPPSERHLASLGNPCSNRFFHQEVIARESGIRCLIAKSQFGLPSLGQQLSDHDVDVQLLLADFILGLTASQRRAFPVLIRKILEMPEYCVDAKQWSASSFSNAGDLSPSEPTRLLCKAPLDYRYLRSTYVEGKDAMIANLPRPRVTGLSGHSYMSLREIVAHHLAFSTPEELECWNNLPVVGDGQPINSLFHCAIAQQAFTEAQSVNHFCSTLPVLFTKWSDDFEPNSQAKQNRGSAWVCTITFSLPPGCTRPATYVVALGDKDLDHSVVEAEFNSEYNELTSGEQWFYHGGAKSVIRCHVFLLAILKDQPERRKGVFISLGNGRFASRWGYCADISSTYHFLPSCPNCRLGLQTEVAHEEDGSTCDQCANWNFNSDLMSYTPPSNYPVVDLDAGTNLFDGQLSPRMLSFERLIEVRRCAWDNYANGRWDVKQTMSYLSVSGLNVDFCTRLIEAVDNEESFEIPPTWSQVRNFHCSIDVPMHLLGLGISKAIHQSIVWVWLVQRRMGSSFTRSSAGKLESVYSLKLSWCKTLPAKKDGALGGWVSENHFAWARICRWYCSSMYQLTEDAPYAAPTKPLFRYTIKECKDWLRAHGVRYAGLTRVSDLRNRIRSVLAEDPTVQPVGPAGGLASNIGDVLCSMCKLFSLCLGPTRVDDTLPVMVHRAVKVFLNSVEIADSELRVPNSKPIWYSKYNFLSLLNLQQMIRDLGLPRWYWEGGPAGEGILRVVKPLVNGGLRPGWAEPTHRAYCAQMAIGQVRRFNNCTPVDKENDSDREDEDDYIHSDNVAASNDDLWTRVISRDCCTYPSINKARWQMRNGRPLSGLVIGESRMFVVIKSRLGLLFHEVVVADRTDVKTLMGMRYYPMTILPTNAEQSDLCDCRDCCILLPLEFSTALDEMASAYYSVLTKEWKELCLDGCFRW